VKIPRFRQDADIARMAAAGMLGMDKFVGARQHDFRAMRL
jgi:hypothetical protein